MLACWSTYTHDASPAMGGRDLLLCCCRALVLSEFLFTIITRNCRCAVYAVIMATSDDIVYRSHSATEGSIEKPAFKNGDKALEFLRSEAEEGEADLIDEKLLVRKIDFMIV